MAKSLKIEPADLTPFQEHMETAAKIGLRRLRRQDALDVSAALGVAFAKEENDERRRLIMSTRLCLLNEQLQKMTSTPKAEPEKPKAKKPKKEPEPTQVEPEPEPTPPPPPAPKKEAKLNTMDLGNAAMLLMSASDDEDEDTIDDAPPVQEDPMDFLNDKGEDTLKSNDAMDYFKDFEDDTSSEMTPEDEMAFLTSGADKPETKDDLTNDMMAFLNDNADQSDAEMPDTDMMSFLTDTDETSEPLPQSVEETPSDDTDFMSFLTATDDDTPTESPKDNTSPDDFMAFLTQDDDGPKKENDLDLFLDDNDDK